MLAFLMLLFFNICNSQENSKVNCEKLISSGISYLEKNDHKNSIKLLLQASILAKNNSWHKEEFQALNNIGNNYFRLFEYGEALNYYLKAYTIAINNLSKNDEIQILNNIAIIYLKEKKYTQAEAYFKLVYSNAKKNKLNIHAGIAAINLGGLYAETNKIIKAIKFNKDALILVANEPKYMLLANGSLANCYLLQGKTKKARELSENILKTSNDLKFYNADIELLLIISKSYLVENQLDLSENFIKQVVEKKPDLESKLEIFRILSEINLKRKSYNLALNYKDSLYDKTILIHKIYNHKLFANSKVKFEVLNYKNQLMVNLARSENEKKNLYYLLFLVSLIAVLILLAVRNLTIKLKQKKLLADRNEKILNLELDKERKESLLKEKQFDENKILYELQQEKLKNEVELKNRKLASKALQMSSKNLIIEEIITDLNNLNQVSKNDALVSHINSLKNQIKTDQEWNQFIIHFEEVNQDFIYKLKAKHTKLTINDIRYVSYIYMNLSTKEIASMLNVTHDSCRKRKERLIQKLELPSETNLHEYLFKL